MITREASGTILTHAGPEIGVASTKAFTGQLTALLLMALYLGQVRGKLTPRIRKDLMQEFTRIPHKMETILQATTRQSKSWRGNSSATRIFCISAAAFTTPSLSKAR